MRGQFVRIGKSSLGRGLVGAAFGSGTFWSLVRAQLVQFVVAQRRGRAGARQPRQPRRQWRAVASRGEQGSKQCGAPDFFDGLGPWACQEAAGWEKLAKNSQAGPGGGCVTEAAIGTRSLVTGVKFFLDCSLSVAQHAVSVSEYRQYMTTCACTCACACACACTYDCMHMHTACLREGE